ncbi:MAG: hypothetical protein ACKVWV_20385 [Planctomycetota bacterium]
MSGTNEPLPFDREAFDPIAQHVLSERASSSVQPTSSASSGEQEVANASPASSAETSSLVDDDPEMVELCAFALQSVAVLLKREMDDATAARGGLLTSRVVKKYFPEVQLGPEGALLTWAVVWYATSKPTKKPEQGAAHGTNQEPSRRTSDTTAAAEPGGQAGFHPLGLGV